jgi:methylated-DNA-[protein]-cysteine S-methyltransferase
MIYYDFIPRTMIGNTLIAATGRGLCAVLIGERTKKGFEKKLAGMFPGETLEESPRHMQSYRKELHEYFSGKRTRFAEPVDLCAVRSPFRRKVLRKLHKLPFGRVTSYGALASQSGSPGAARAVGTAMATNPLSIVIPCHRVVASSGGLGGYGGGLPTKEKLLRHEGVEPTRSNLLREIHRTK